ncbi:MAG TPA: pantoate--beta-alanine ligase [Chloroflexota bacterium]
MRRLLTIPELRDALRDPRGTVGLVPTMGFLHAGHMSLVKTARDENDVVVVTIFVNPTQFGPNEDLATYPRDMERDLSLLEVAGVDFVFTPEASEMYPSGYSSYVTVEGLTDKLEGAFRPGHFRGVATVVSKLLNLVPADRAYFGQKDAQQVVVIRRMASDLNFRHEISVVPTVREPDGLALSSRNVYLSPEQRRSALALSRSLFTSRDLFEAGEREAGKIRSAAEAVLFSEPGVKVDYVAVVDRDTFEDLETIQGEALVVLAARVGPTRLIDNVVLGLSG